MTAFLTGKIVACPACGSQMREQLQYTSVADKFCPTFFCDACNHTRNLMASRTSLAEDSARSDAHCGRPADEELSGARRYMA